MKLPISYLSLTLAASLGAACDLEVNNLNTIDREQFEEAPTPSLVSEAVVGMQIANRAGKGGANGYLSILGILGRESYNFDSADPRYRTELLETNLNAGSPAFGGNFWTGPYQNIGNGFMILNALDRVEGMEDTDKNAVRGFVKTIQAHEFLTLVNTRYDQGVALDVNRPLGSELAPLVTDPQQAYDFIADLLDQAQADLEGAGEAFPFPVQSGLAEFATPADFIELNRALKARTDIYREECQDALTALDASFISEEGDDLDDGAYWVYSTGPGDATNGLTNPNLYANPDFVADAQLKEDGGPDDRVTRKTYTKTTMGTAQSILLDEDMNPYVYSSTLGFGAYQSNVASVPIIRNEELLLLRAEANICLGNLAEAVTDINIVRENSGGLPPIEDLTAESAEDVLLYERRYSLFMEGGHRWIDMRRFDRLPELNMDDPFPGLAVYTAFPIPIGEQNARNPETR